MTRNVLILGASYGSLVATKLLLAGHRVTLVCTAPTAELFRREGSVVRFPVKGRDGPLALHSGALPGTLSASTPEQVDPGAFDLVVLGMQEAQYGAAGVAALMRRIARARVPCLAIMNMPPPPYLERIPGLATAALQGCYAHPAVWQDFEPALMTLASPDPQAFRPPGEPKNVLQVGLATNFKAARFDDEAPTALLREIEAGVEAVRFAAGGEAIEIPVKLKVHESVFVPLAKWPMLMAGNYRCVQSHQMISIRDAVHADVAASRAIYEWVADLCVALGAAPDDLVQFEKYAKAAEGLGKPSSAARALFGGAMHIERVDALVQRIARQRGLQLGALDETVALVDARLKRNREADRIAQEAVAATA